MDQFAATLEQHAVGDGAVDQHRVAVEVLGPGQDFSVGLPVRGIDEVAAGADQRADQRLD